MTDAPADRPVEAVVFGLRGVVFRYLPERRLQAFARVTGRSESDLQKALMDSGYSRSCEAGRLTGEAAYREGIRLLGQRVRFSSFRAHWISAFEPDPEVVALVQRLRQSRPVAMLANGSDLVRSGLEERHSALMDLFRPRLFSADAGILKPDPRLFGTLLELLNLPAERVLYVDDEPASAATAAALGMVAHRFESPSRLMALLVSQALIR